MYFMHWNDNLDSIFRYQCQAALTQLCKISECRKCVLQWTICQVVKRNVSVTYSALACATQNEQIFSFGFSVSRSNGLLYPVSCSAMQLKDGRSKIPSSFTKTWKHAWKTKQNKNTHNDNYIVNSKTRYLKDCVKTLQYVITDNQVSLHNALAQWKERTWAVVLQLKVWETANIECNFDCQHCCIQLPWMHICYSLKFLWRLGSGAVSATKIWLSELYLRYHSVKTLAQLRSLSCKEHHTRSDVRSLCMAPKMVQNTRRINAITIRRETIPGFWSRWMKMPECTIKVSK